MYDIEEVYLTGNKVVGDEHLKYVIRRIKDEEPEKAENRNNGLEWSEMGMGELFSRCYHDTIRYCTTQKSWYAYQDGRWVYDTASVMASSAVKEFVRICRLYGDTIKDEKIRDDWFKFCVKMNDRRFRDRMLKDAQDQSAVAMEEFDANPYLVNCRNGTFDLKSGKFRRHSPDDLLTMQTRFDYVASKEERPHCERWEAFIDQITEGNREKAAYIQRAYGYSILGMATAECMFIWYGKTSRNGKSTLQNAIEHMMGDYAAVAPVAIICKQKQADTASTASPMLAMLKGKRIVTMSESADYGKMDEQAVKSMTGGESITARKLYAEPMTFLPQFTLFLSTNSLPAVTDKSLFASDRLRVVEFNRHFDLKERDESLKGQFSEDSAMSGIFTWLLEGYAEYKKKGLQIPDSLKYAVVDYEKDNDVVLQFLSERTEKSENDKVRLKTLFEYYRAWCNTENRKAMSAKSFAKNVERLSEFYTDMKNHSGSLCLTGIKVREE